MTELSDNVVINVVHSEENIQRKWFCDNSLIMKGLPRNGCNCWKLYTQNLPKNPYNKRVIKRLFS
jgi:hypothetical protein